MEGKSEVRLCEHCGGDIEIRNPSGYCDHLYYPEYCETCKRDPIKVLSDNVLIKRDPLPENKIGLIHLPDAYAGIQHKVQDRGVILAVGPNVKNKDIKAGIRILFGRFAYQDFERDKNTILVKECDCLAVGDV